MNKFNYKNLCPFKWFVLQNFPFIEADFDAITNWQLFCKLGEEMNKIIEKVNQAGEQTENLTNAFIELQNYVNDYFENLDVQEEINNKLDEMAEGGTLAEIINQDIFNELNTKVDNLYNNRSILLSDSYFDWSPDETIELNNRYWKKFFDMMNITDYYAYNKGGIGFYQKVDNENFLSILQNHYNDIQEKDTIKNIFVFGGYNDAFDDNTTIQNINDAINDFVAYCKTNYPNAKVYIGEIGYDTNLNWDGTTRRNKINNKVIPAYCNTTYNSNNPHIYLPNLNYCLHNKDYMSTDGIHPNTAGHNALANGIYSAFNKGFECLPINEEYPTITPINYATGSVQLYVKNTPPTKVIRINNFVLNWDNSHLQTFSENLGIEVASTSESKTILPVYDVDFCTFGMIGYSDSTYEILPIKIRFAYTGNIVINVLKLNSSGTAWEPVSNVNSLQIWQQELSTTMNVL